MSKNNKNSKHSLPSTNGLTRTRGDSRNGSDKLTGRTKACAYLRVASSDKNDQDISLQAQTEAVEALAEREGYEIVQRYTDASRSASKNGEKHGLAKLLEDAPTAEWEVVLCSDRSRLTRLDSIEEGLVVRILRQFNKRLHTAAEGVVDWTTSTGRIIDSIHNEQARTYAANLGRRTLEGKLIIFSGGRSAIGTCPYGYRFRVTDPRGNVHEIPRMEQFAVPKGWTKAPVPGDPNEVEVVHWLFAEYATKDVSFNSLARGLNAKGVSSPWGQKWTGSAIVRLLANDAYVGDTRFGRRSSGRFYRLDGDKVVEANRNAQVKRQEGLVRHDTHEGVISRELWDRVQEKLNRR